MNAKKLGACLMALEYGTFMITIVVGWNLLNKISSSCSNFRFLGITIIFIGVAILVLFYVGCATIDFVPEISVIKSVCCSVPLVLALAALGIFALAVSSKGGGKSINGISYKEYHIESYSGWMQNKVNDTHDWNGYYKKAVVKGDVCKKFSEDYQLDTLNEFHNRKLSPFESGCCKPQEDCKFSYSNPTIWVKPEDYSNYSNIDCNGWDNDPKIRCFNCHSCKAAFIEDITGQWFEAGLICVFLATKQVLLGICLLSILLSRASSQSYNALA